MPWAQINESGIVFAVTNQPIGITCEESDIGRHWTGTAFEDVPAAPIRIIRDWQFRDRFTQAQLVGIMRAAMSGDDTAAFVWLKISTASDGVNLDDPSHIAGVQYVATTYPALGIDPAVVLA